MYYDIDDILCEDVQVGCSLNVTLFQGSFLSPEIHTEDGNLLEGTHIKLPFWMAKCLAGLERDEKPLAEIEVLEFFEQDFQTSLEADPCIVNLRQNSTYYFELGIKFCDLLPEETHKERFEGARKLRFTLQDAFQKRLLYLMMNLNISIDFLKLFTDSERQNLYQMQKCQKEYEIWEEKLNKRQPRQVNKKIKNI